MYNNRIRVAVREEYILNEGPYARPACPECDPNRIQSIREKIVAILGLISSVARDLASMVLLPRQDFTYDEIMEQLFCIVQRYGPITEDGIKDLLTERLGDSHPACFRTKVLFATMITHIHIYLLNGINDGVFYLQTPHDNINQIN
jgi:hypothetical protein